MSIQILPENQTFGTSLAQGISEGLAESLPKEIERLRLRKGLQNVLSQQYENPAQQLASLATLPGIEPGLVQSLLPYLQKQQANRQSLELANQRANLPFGLQSLDRAQEQKEETFQTPVRPLQEEINREAAKSFEKFPAAFGYDFEKAKAEAQEIANTRYQHQLDINARGEDAVKNFDQKLETTLGKDYLLQTQSLGFKLREQMREKAKQEGSKEGANPAKIGEKYATQAEKVIKSEQNLRDISDAANFSLFKPRDREAVNELRQNLKVIKDQGVPLTDTIDILAADLGTDRAFASYIADPLYDSEAAKLIRKLPSQFFHKKKNAEQELAKQISQVIKPSDTIGSLVYLAREKRLDPLKFKTALAENIKFPSNYQTEQLNSELTRGKPSLKQLFLQDLGLLEEVKKYGIRNTKG